MSDEAPGAGRGRLDPRPLYARVEEILTRRIAQGLWLPGAPLPAEPEIASELGVSHGTVRRALDALERRHLVERRQGRGTFVAAHTSERALFHFFRVVDAEGRKTAPPTSRALACDTAAVATRDEAAALRLAEGAAVHRILRLRLIGGTPCMFERIVLPAALFPGFSLPLDQELPDELYVLYQRRHGVFVSRAEEMLTACAADAATARALARRPGDPLLEIARTAFDLQGRPVERRVSLLDALRHRYRVDLD